MTSWKDMMNTIEFWGVDRKAKESLKEKSRNKIKVVPSAKDMYRTFRITDIDNIKVIILGGEPYPWKDHANGLPFSSFKEEAPKDLEVIKEYINHYEDGKGVFECNDLESWSRQGVLLLNVAFSTEAGKPGSMIDEWINFTRQVIYYLEQRHNNIIYWSLGNVASNLINSIVIKPIHINTPHPYEFMKTKRSPIDEQNFVNPLLFINAELSKQEKSNINFNILKPTQE